MKQIFMVLAALMLTISCNKEDEKPDQITIEYFAYTPMEIIELEWHLNINTDEYILMSNIGGMDLLKEGNLESDTTNILINHKDWDYSLGNPGDCVKVEFNGIIYNKQNIIYGFRP